jgi:hypothetical protein
MHEVLPSLSGAICNTSGCLNGQVSGGKQRKQQNCEQADG